MKILLCGCYDGVVCLFVCQRLFFDGGHGAVREMWGRVIPLLLFAGLVIVIVIVIESGGAVQDGIKAHVHIHTAQLTSPGLSANNICPYIVCICMYAYISIYRTLFVPSFFEGPPFHLDQKRVILFFAL